MAAILLKTGSWLYDGSHTSRVQIFKNNVPLREGPDEDGPYPTLPTDNDGFYYYAQVTIPGGGSGQLALFDNPQAAMDHAAMKLPSPIKWD